MRKKTLLLILLLFLTLNVQSKTVTIGNLYYDLNGNSATVYGSLNMTGNIIIPSTVNVNGSLYKVTTIGQGAFEYCSLTSITIPPTIKHIENSAFQGIRGDFNRVEISDLKSWCQITFYSNPLISARRLYVNGQEVKNLIIPQTVTVIPSNAFEGCISIQSVEFPSHLEKIDCNAFRGCENLKEIFCYASVPPQILWGAFQNMSSITLHVPKAKKDLYLKTSGWENFKHIIGDL